MSDVTDPRVEGWPNGVSVWFSTRRAVEVLERVGPRAVTELLRPLCDAPPAALLVGSSSGVTRFSQARVVSIVRESLEKLAFSSRPLLIDWPSHAAHVAGTGDLTVVMSFLNSSAPAVNIDRVTATQESLHEAGHPYRTCGFLLLANGGAVLPSVAEVGLVDRPLPPRPYLMSHYVRHSPLKFDFAYLDRGSDPPEGPLSCDDLADALQPCRDLPPILVGGGIKNANQARSILAVPGVRGIAIGTVFEEEPQRAVAIIDSVTS